MSPLNLSTSSGLGAQVDESGTHFRVWALSAQHVDLVLDGTVFPLKKEEFGFYSIFLPGVRAGARYGYRLNGDGPFPDPASRSQPDGVEGLSEVVDLNFKWTDPEWVAPPLERWSIYELHVGTFTTEGTFTGVREKLPYLKDLGIRAIELMPVNDFKGARNWGYDGVSLFAPSRAYGRPDELMKLVDAAHAQGIAMILDVVYNHLGPEGNFLSRYSNDYFTDRHQTPWGPAVNLDGAHSKFVRQFFIQNALQWLRFYHFDGLRLDATHALADDSNPSFLQELSSQVRSEFPDKIIPLIAEDHRNLSQLIQPIEEKGCGLSGVWADDFHHQMRVALAGDREGYYSDYTGSTDDLVQTIQQGWFYTGQYSSFGKAPRGTTPQVGSYERFVFCLQNHDQIGNRPFGDRLSQSTSAADYRAASTLLLTLPHVPLLFMGQEWGASSPFLFFSDFSPELGKRVTLGRREEFKSFSAFSDPETREKIPDPQSEETFRKSQLNWAESEKDPHLGCLRLYKRLLGLRMSEKALQSSARETLSSHRIGPHTLLVIRKSPSAASVAILVHLKGPFALPTSDLPQKLKLPLDLWETLLSSEDEEFGGRGRENLYLAGPAALIFRELGYV